MTKVAVVTGSNKGVGFAIVKGLAEEFEGDIYLTARNEERGISAVKELQAKGSQVHFYQLDITDIESVKGFQQHIKNKHGGIDILINNAGIAFNRDATEPMPVQAEVTVKTNYFGTKQTCEILFPILNAGARIVNVSSSSGFLPNVNGDEPEAKNLREKLASSDSTLTTKELDDIMISYINATKDGTHTQKGWGSSTYVASKVGLSALSRIQQREFFNDSRKDIVVNHIHPGYVDTDMSSHKGEKTPEEGAKSSIYCALLPPETSIRGQYIWHDCQVVDWVNGPKPAV